MPGDVGATCVGDVPYLAYDLTLPEGFGEAGPTPLTITFVNPSGENYVVSNLPLKGEMLWPGASATEPLMWPGWDLVNGEYVDVGNDNFGWTRNGITVAFDVNPHYETTLTYPPATVACANPPGQTPPNTPPQHDPRRPRRRPRRPPRPSNPPGVVPAAGRTRPLPNTGGPNGGLAGLGALLLLGGLALRATGHSGADLTRRRSASRARPHVSRVASRARSISSSDADQAVLVGHVRREGAVDDLEAGVGQRDHPAAGVAVADPAGDPALLHAAIDPLGHRT